MVEGFAHKQLGRREGQNTETKPARRLLSVFFARDRQQHRVQRIYDNKKLRTQDGTTAVLRAYLAECSELIELKSANSQAAISSEHAATRPKDPFLQAELRTESGTDRKDAMFWRFHERFPHGPVW